MTTTPDPWDLLERACQGDTRARAGLRKQLAWVGSPTLFLIELALRHAGTRAQRRILDRALDDRPWADHVRLRLQEYRTVLPSDVQFDESISAVLSVSDWGGAHSRALRARGDAGVAGARALRRDLDAVAAEAVGFAGEVTASRRRITESLHLLQVMALERLVRALRPLRGRRILEVGTQDGGLLAELRRRGADGWAVDLAPRVTDKRVIVGDFMKGELAGGWDAVVATAVFEFGSGWEHPPPPGEPDRALLSRLHALVRPGGVVVMENIGFPVPFDARAAVEAGFQVLDPRTVVHTMTEAGRGCTLRRAPLTRGR